MRPNKRGLCPGVVFRGVFVGPFPGFAYVPIIYQPRCSRRARIATNRRLTTVH